MADDPAQLNSAGLQAQQRGDAVGAVALFRRAVALDPKAAILWYNLAHALALTGNTVAHATALDEALGCDPFMPHALLAKGLVLEAQGHGRDSLEHFRRLAAVVHPSGQYEASFAAGLAHARSKLEEANSALSAKLDTALSASIAAAPPEAAHRFRHAMDVQLGQRRVYVHQPLVMHYPYLPAEQFLARRHFPWLEHLEAAAPAIRDELSALLATGATGFAPYVAYPIGTPVSQWVELNHNDAWAAQFLVKHGEQQSAVLERCPQTAAVLDTLPLFDLPGRGPVAFFSLLKPRTRIPSHTGATNIRTIIHLPLIVPEGCGFRVGNETVQWTEGRAFAFDDSIEHEAWNDSDELRAVLIIDTWNPHISPPERMLLAKYIAALDGTGRSFD